MGKVMADHAHHHDELSSDSKSIRLAFVLNLSFALIEIVGGIWTNSLAILSDALHDFGDSLSIGISWFLDRYSHKKEDRSYTYGYRRFSLLAALINTIVLLVGAFIILSQAIPRLMEPQHSNAQGMVVLALVGILVNGVAVLRLKEGRSMNMRVLTWHLLEDVLGWVAVLVVSVIMLFADIHILDPILSILVIIYVLVNVVRNLKKTLAIFLQGTPEGIDLAVIQKHVESLPEVRSTHHLHAWSLEGENHVLTLHVVVDEGVERKEVIELRAKIRGVLASIGLKHSTIEIEYGENDCMLSSA
jgi:cobalt-zinc-cadmium efflux system protein